MLVSPVSYHRWTDACFPLSPTIDGWLLELYRPRLTRLREQGSYKTENGSTVIVIVDSLIITL
jgi:hypothetical protein